MWFHFFHVQSCPLFLGCLKGLDHDGHGWPLAALPCPHRAGTRQSQLLSLLTECLGLKGEIPHYICQKSGCWGERNPQIAG